MLVVQHEPECPPGLVGDWLISRQRFFGVPFPVWYRLDSAGEPIHDDPILAPEASLPVDPSGEALLVDDPSVLDDPPEPLPEPVAVVPPVPPLVGDAARASREKQP